MTHNEPWAITITSVELGGDKSTPEDKKAYIVAHNLLLAHAKVYKLYQEKYKTKQKGMFSYMLQNN